MAVQKHMYPFIIILSFISCYTSLRDGPPHSKYVQEESGFDFENSAKLQTGIYGFKTFQRLAASANTINVDDFGAKGDGTHDDTQAFQMAWQKACSSTGAILVVPQKKNYLLKPIRFSGPCKSKLTMQIYGTITASSDRLDYKTQDKHWLIFDSIQNLIVEGGGVINGNGKIWWQNSCKINKALPCKDAPTALTFYNGNNLIVNNLKIQDAQQIHVSFEKCVNVQTSNLKVTAPATSPNTDGIHITDTQNIQISNCIIGTGDDCISIVSGSQKVQATAITFGPGHGISIGSLGSENSKAYVSDVTVNGATFYGTKNGVRIKTWPGGSGSASGIKFQNIDMHDVTNPIIIDQNYCDQAKSCPHKSSTIQVNNVIYQNIKGTSASDVAVNLECSDSFPCQGVVLQNINIVKQGGGEAKALCNNVSLKKLGAVLPQCT
ncbi:unnamed protein product [Ilex paraguariensis]|uniref:endo-polygalacturonase n=1 Tax=Ilex paraguariensis TaxID=185542 RepID=A0ABC8UUX4_9AQUA